MALEAVVFPQELFGYSYKDLYSSLGGASCWNISTLLGFHEDDEEIKNISNTTGAFCEENLQQGLPYNFDHNLSAAGSSSSALLQNVDYHNDQQTHYSSPDQMCHSDGSLLPGTGGMLNPPVVAEATEPSIATVVRRKRRRTKTSKNKEEVENQRMTHITVERNRRRQMNEYLAVLRSLMPPSYVQRGDQASIIGGAINFVKELEQLLQTLEGQKQIKQGSSDSGDKDPSPPFANFFTYPQYSSSSSSTTSLTQQQTYSTSNESLVADNRSAVADIEVTMVESHANLKVLSERRPKQLLKMVSGFQCLRLTILHLNVTTVKEMVLYSLSVKIEEDCQLTSVDEIATAVHEMLRRIQEETRR